MNDAVVNIVNRMFECVISIRPDARICGDVTYSAAVIVATPAPNSRRANAYNISSVNALATKLMTYWALIDDETNAWMKYGSRVCEMSSRQANGSCVFARHCVMPISVPSSHVGEMEAMLRRCRYVNAAKIRTIAALATGRD